MLRSTRRFFLHSTEAFILWIFLTVVSFTFCEPDCKALHARASGVNLEMRALRSCKTGFTRDAPFVDFNTPTAEICCSLHWPLIDSCEYSSLCNKEQCECHLHIDADLKCELEETEARFVWLDHQQHREKLSCTQLDLPNRNHPYRIVIHHWNETLTPYIFRGLVDVNVTELRIHDVDETTSFIELAKFTPHLRKLEITARSRERFDVSSTFHHLKSLESLRIFNVNLQFSRTVSPWVRSIVHINIENSSLSELPPWLALNDKLQTLSIKRLRSLKMSENKIDDIAKYVFLGRGIYDIDLSKNKISSFASHTFALCTELRVLDLSDNPITALPYRPFSRNAKLKWLKLSATRIKALLPEHFVGLTALKSLTLSYSPLQSIASTAFLPMKSLKTLDLEATNITAIPAAITQNCGLTHLNVANNILHRRSSFPPEVVALLSSLTVLKLDGNPLREFPSSLLLLSTDNFRLIRQLFQTLTSLPVWTEEPCTPYYWAMHLRNRSMSFRNLVSTWNDTRMDREGLTYCRDQYEWMLEEIEIYRDLEKNSGCSAHRRFRSAAITQKTSTLCHNSSNAAIKGRQLAIGGCSECSHLLWVSLVANFFFLCLMLAFVCLLLCCGGKEKY